MALNNTAVFFGDEQLLLTENRAHLPTLLATHCFVRITCTITPEHRDVVHKVHKVPKLLS